MISAAQPVPSPDLPAAALSGALAGWLAGPRGRALRRARIGLRRLVLEIGSAHGVVTPELRRRSRGRVVSLDLRVSPSGSGPDVIGDCRDLPFAAGCFDLVFFQNVLLWVPEVARAITEAARVLQPGGDLVAIEPDFGGMLEYPDLGLRQIWLDGLRRAGADPCVGRRLAGACEAAGLRPWVELAHLPRPASPDAVRLLEGLPLTNQERSTAALATQRLLNRTGDWSVFLHVPYFIVVASKPA